VLLFCYKILGNGRTTAATNNVPLLIENLKIIAINPFSLVHAIKSRENVSINLRRPLILIFILGIQKKENYTRFCAEIMVFQNAMSTTDVQNTNAVAVKTHRYMK
jgi:hypothetical protein